MRHKNKTLLPSRSSLLDFGTLVVPPEQMPKPEENQETITDPYGNCLPLIIFQESGGWADGDVTLPALERLALLMLDDCMIVHYGPPVEALEEKYQWKMECHCFIPAYERYFYRCVSSGIVEGSVWGAYMYESCLMDFTRYRDRDEEEVVA